MSFLHGVLSNIQPKLGQHKDTLNIALNSLNNSNNNGITKYKAAIAAVADGVHTYNEKVAASNDAVKSVVTTLREFSERALDTAIKVEHAEKSIDLKVEDCKKNAQTFITNIDTSRSDNPLNNAISDLNAKLKDKLENVRKTVAYESDRLGEVKGYEHTEMTQAIENVEKVMSTLKTNVDCKIDTQVKLFVTKVREQVEPILKELKKISKSLHDYVAELGRWIDNANSAVDKALEMAKKILYEVNEDAVTNNPGRMKAAIEQIDIMINQLVTAGNTGLDEVRKEVTAALTAVKTMDGQLKEDLHGVRGAISQAVGRITEKVQKLGEQFPKISGAPSNLNDIFEEIKKKVEEIQGGQRPAKGLGSIKNGVNGYLGEFSVNFADKVQEWLDDILGKEAVRRGEQKKTGYLEDYITDYIKEYIGDHQRDGIPFKNGKGAPDEIIKELREQFQKILGSEASEAGNLVHQKIQEAKGAVEKNIEAIHVGCNMFATRLGEKLYTKVTDIVSAVEKAIHNGTPVTKKSDLTYIVEVTLLALHSKARQAGKELHSFALDKTRVNRKESIAAEIDKVVNMTSILFESVKNAHSKRTGGSWEYPAQAVDQAISNVTETLNQQLKLNTDGNSVVIEGTAEGVFRLYKLQVTQSTLTGDVNELEGTLPDAIKKIRTQVQSALDDVGNINIHVEERLREVKDKLSLLCRAVKNAAETDAESAVNKLKLLKSLINDNTVDIKAKAQKGLNKIHSDLSNLRNELVDKPIDLTNKLLSYLTSAQNHYIKQLQEDVKKEVNSAQSKLTTHARRQYVEALKFALQQFADKVTEELEPLPGMFEQDKHIGLKGFMEAFYGANSGDNINKLKDAVDLRTVCHGFEKFLGPLNTYMNMEIDRLKEEEHKKNPSLQKPQDPYSKQLNNVYSSLSTVIGHIMSNNYYDHNLPTKLAELTATLSDLKLDGFPNPVTGMLGGISGGCRQLVDVLGDVYISKYDGLTIEWEKVDTSKKASTPDGPENKIPTDDANRCAKVFLTCMYTLFDKLHRLFFNGGKTWASLKIDGSGDAKKKYELKKYFMHEGFEIQNLVTKENTGKDVAFRLSRAFSRYQTFNKDPNEFDSFDLYIAHFRKYEGLLSRLFEHLETYNEVCHFATFSSTKHPSSIYEMLAWFSGLPYSSVYDSLLHDVLPSLFEGPSKKPADDDEIEVTDLGEESFDAYPQPITYSSLATSLNDVCAQSYDVLTGVLGYGYAGGVYACDHSNNTLNLAYPSSASACLGMLVDVMNRLFFQLYFLLTQCSHNTDYSGWSNCSYGQGVGNSGWQCNDNQCANQTCPQKAIQSTNQKCNQHPKCGVKSPLQSYLEDSLPGFLPHTFSNVGCGVKCSVGNHFGKPCITPMGFTDISIKASHTKEGEYLQKVLEKFCGKAESPLTKLCSQLNCLLPTAPKTLGDMFSFYYNFLRDWNRNTPHRKGAFEEAISKANFKRPYEDLNAHFIFGGSHPHKQANADLVSLVCSSATRGKCGPYLHALNTDISSMYSKEHGGKYLSWIVYSTETFYNLLHQLYDDCCSTCGGDKPKCRIAKCPQNCSVGGKSATSPHDASCNSIAKCSHTRPIMYKFGFVHENVAKLAGETTKRTCTDFCHVLKKVIGEGCALVKLIEDIDKYIWAIREKFSYLLLALWSLSLLYLLHIAVVRLDVLKIRSHLKSPASHRIAAQSLLAAARINSLSKLAYLKP
ncbi:hypothetical protein, conserved [Babesia ovata]|uniref:C3H1-type domain-containing protein n=1 Tax=Babesia ovata TaxID=189622 RepID=A0A2H6KIX4_9APIC|nr:uncharacterized protein BOVATA_044290 [Babesia ovata]GBE62936.1 hypothetical protein, conserved [Babesia ovata]